MATDSNTANVEPLNRVPVILDVAGLVEVFAEWRRQGEPDATAEELSTAALRVGRNNAPALAGRLYYRRLLTPANCGLLVAWAWSGAEYPQRWIPAQTWRALFALAGYTDDGVPAKRPDGPLNVYRGAPKARRRGWAWTASRDVAEWFADRWTTTTGSQPSTVWRATVEPSRLYCHLHEGHRGEDEYVIDTRGGLRVEEVGSVAAARVEG